jgi:hypothetical protein
MAICNIVRLIRKGEEEISVTKLEYSRHIMKQKVINYILSKLTFTCKRKTEFSSGNSFIKIVFFLLMAFLFNH